MKITIYATELSSDKAEFGFYCHTCSPSVYRGEYRATLQGNILTLQHREIENLVFSFALSFDMDRELSKAFNNSHYLAQAYRIIQRTIQLKALQLVKEINRGV